MKISLIGFMGAGKTTVAKILAKKLCLSFVEMDDLVLKKSGRKSINEIFAKDGEIHFRELEVEAAKILKDKDDLIISTGGGVVMNRIIIDYLKTNGKVIFLQTSFEAIEKRLKNDDSRPLFKDKIKAKKLYEFRQPLYEQYADIIINTDKKTVEKVVMSLRKKLDTYF